MGSMHHFNEKVFFSSRIPAKVLLGINLNKPGDHAWSKKKKNGQEEREMVIIIITFYHSTWRTFWLECNIIVPALPYFIIFTLQSVCSLRSFFFILKMHNTHGIHNNKTHYIRSSRLLTWSTFTFNFQWKCLWWWTWTRNAC